MSNILEDSWTIDLRKIIQETALIEEYGCSSPVQFTDESTVTAYDSQGNEMEIPKCDKCDQFKCQVIGKERFAWMCMNGCN